MWQVPTGFRAWTAAVIVSGMLLLAGCSTVASRTPAGSDGDAATPPPPAGSAPSVRDSPPVATAGGTPGPGVPADVPIPEGSVRLDVGAEDGLLATWSVALNGADAYAWFGEALPAAGYPIEELIPGGTAAIVRFRGRDGAAWLLILRGMNPLIVELRVDDTSASDGDVDR